MQLQDGMFSFLSLVTIARALLQIVRLHLAHGCHVVCGNCDSVCDIYFCYCCHFTILKLTLKWTQFTQLFFICITQLSKDTAHAL